MSEDRLNLAGDELGDDSAGDEDEGEKKRKRRGGDDKPGARTKRRHDAALRGRLESTLERVIEWLEGRGDLELAGVIREDGRAMVGGLVTLTRPLEWLRPPIVAVLSVVEPLLAFGRVGRVLAGRWAERRARRADEHERRLAEPDETEPDGPPEPSPY